MSRVISGYGVPKQSVFNSANGTPIYIDLDTGWQYCLKDNQVYRMNVGGSGGASWGGITGTLEDQTDLQDALDAKGTSNFSGAYNDLTGKPSLFDGAYNSLTGKPTLFNGVYSSLSSIPSTFPPIIGAGANQAVAGNDSRLSDARTPLAHSQTASTISDSTAVGRALLTAADQSAGRTAIGAGTSSFSGDYNTLTNKPSLGTVAPLNTNGNAAQFLNGAGAWATPGGGSDPWTIASLANDFTTSSATAVDIGLGFTPDANTNYMFEAVLGIRTATATVNPRVGLAWPTGMSDGVAQIDESQTATTRLMANGNINAAILMAVGGIPNTNQSWPVTVWGWARSGATPSGQIRLQLASETAGTVVRVVARSYLRYRTYP